MSKKNEILKQAGIYSLATQITQAITVVASLLSRSFLGPTQTGIWATLQILVDYSKYTTLGMMAAVSREIPYAVGKGQPEEAEKVKNLAFSFILMSSTVIALGVTLFALASQNRFRPEIAYGLMFAGGLIFLQRFNNLLIALLRCYKRFEVESELMILSAIVNAVLVAVLTYFFKIYGFLWAQMASFLFNIGYVLIRHRFHFKWYYAAREFRPLLAYGLPLMAIGAMTTLFKSLDKVIVVKLLGFEAMGYYSIATMVYAYMSNFHSSVAVVLLPHFQEKFGSKDNPRDLAGYLKKSSDAFALTVPGLIGAVWILAPVFIHAFLPKFIPGIPAMKILAFNMFFVAMVHPYQDFLMTVKKHGILFPIQAVSIGVVLGLGWLAVRLDMGLEGVALATVCAGVINFTFIYFLSVKTIFKFRESVRDFLKYMSIFMAFTLALVLIQEGMEGWGQSVFKVIIKLAVFFVVYSPALWMLDREFHLIQLIRSKIPGLRVYPDSKFRFKS